MRAIETYDPEKSLFSTYATPWIHSAIRRSVLEKDPTIRKPEDIEFLSRKYEKLLQEYQEKHNREPSDAYIKEQLKISDKTLHFFKEKINYDTVSLNQGIGPEEDSLELEDIIASPHNDYNNLLDNLENFNLINIIRSLLTEKEYYIIYYRIISNKQETLKTIAGQLGISAETIRVLEKKALKKIKPFIKKNSDLYQREVERQKKKQGNFYYKLKEEPLKPEIIYIFLYVKDKLSLLEKKIFYFKWIDKYKYTEEDLKRIFGLSKDMLEKVISHINKIIKEQISNTKIYKDFKSRCIK